LLYPPSMKDVPSLFGRVTSVLSDHARLRETVKDLRAACETAVADGSGQELRVLTVSFSMQLRDHFSAEEAEGNFGAIQQARPDLREAIARRVAEHLQMRGILDALDVSVRRMDVADLATVVVALLRMLERHEHEESGLVREFVAWQEAR
jgi:hemerythrin